MFTTSFFIFCVFSINCLCKEIISISIDNDNLKDSSNESEEKNIHINIKNPARDSNIIPILSSSTSLENDEHAIPGRQQSPWMQESDEQKTNSEKKQSRRILSSIEETRQPWAETKRDNIYGAKIRTQPRSNQIMQHKSTDHFKERKAPSVMAFRYAERRISEGILQEMASNISAKIHSENMVNNIPDVRLDSKMGKYSQKKTLRTESLRRNKAPTEVLSNSTPKNRQIASGNSTIEVSDREYQAHRNAKVIAESESDNDDETESFDDYPYSASVQRKGAHYTSGAVVGVRWVLSTAAEFYHVRESIRFFRIRVGSVDCKKNGILTPLKRIAVHPNFKPNNPAYDISVLKTSVPLELSSAVKPIGLSRLSGDVTAEKFVTTYWPRIVIKDGVVPPTAKERINHNSMRVSTQKQIPSDQCSQRLKSVDIALDKNSLCLRPLKIHHSDCMPDAGAPVVAVDGLWGITSGWVSAQCPTILLPTMVTRVTKLGVRSWLEEQMKH